MRVVTASFAEISQAESFYQILGEVGIWSRVVSMGPRAYQVEVDEQDDERAAEILAELGYLSCAV